MLEKAFKAEIRGKVHRELGCRDAAQHKTMRILDSHSELGLVLNSVKYADNRLCSLRG